MVKRIDVLLLSGLFALLLAACAEPVVETPTAEATAEPTGEAGQPDEEGVTLVLGDISDDPANVIEEMQLLADYLAANLADHGVAAVDIKVVETPEEMAAALESGEIDLYFDSVYPATLVSDASGAQPFLRRWRDGVEEYHSVIFVRSDSGIESLEDLQGQLVAFDEPTSTSGFVLPYVYLVGDQGFTLSEKTSLDDQVAPDEIGYIFSDDDDTSLEWVNSRQVAAAATDDVSYVDDIPDDVRGNFTILAETEALPRQVAVVRPGMDEDLMAAIVDVLLHIHESEEGQAALEEFDDTARFDEFPEGLEAALDRMREMLEVVRQGEASAP